MNTVEVRPGARGMSWRRRAVIGTVTGLVATILAELGYVAVAAAEDPSIGIVEYTGTPITDSAVTLTGDSAFPNLEVTVTQTKGLTNQAVTVVWSGMNPGTLENPFFLNYLQIMQCWGDDPTAPAGQPAPARETCQYGAYDGTAQGPKDPGAHGQDNYARTRTVLRADALERAALGKDGKPLNYYTGTATGGTVPFYPVSSGWPDAAGAQPVKAPFGQPIDNAGGGVFGYAETNELPYNRTRLDGTGEQTVEIQTTLESPSLGCGAPVGDPDNPTGRPCWLVVVPRGATDDGFRPGTVVDPAVPGGQHNIKSSPLTAAAWQHKLAFRLEFRPVGEQCPLGTAQRRIIGGETAKAAFLNWAPALCTGSKVPYNLTTLSETAARNTIVSTIPGSTRAALVSRPLARDPDHPVSYAPVALSGVAVGFMIERYVTDVGHGTPPQAEQDIMATRLPRLNLTPRIAAKLLTESYGVALPPPDPNATAVPPEYLANNPRTLFQDPDVVAANPELKWLFASQFAAAGGAPLTVLENSDATWALWRWVNADQEARGFLDGQADPWGMTVNPNFKGLALPIENFPKADPTCTTLTEDQKNRGATTPVCVIDWAPYVDSLADAARRTQSGRPGGVTSRWYGKDDIDNPDPITGVNPGIPHWAKVGTHNPGQRFVLCVTSTAEASRFGLSTASLRNASGNFVAPDEAGLQAGAQAMINDPDEPRVKIINPAATAPNAYPLPMITYAAVAVGDIDTTGDPTARTELAGFVEYAAGPGQARGLALGQLPPGYSPLPFNLRLQAKGAVNEIKTGRVAGYDRPPSPSASATPTGTGTTSPPAAGGVPSRGSVPSAVPTRSSRGPEPVAVVQSGRTPGDPVTVPPWVLLVGLGVGLASGFAAPFVRPRRRPVDP